MRRTGMWIVAVLVAVFVFYPLPASSRKGGAQASSTGAPITNDFSEATCGSASNCHTNSSGGTGRISIDAPSEYIPGTALEFKVRVEEEGRSTFGFQVAVKAVNGTLHEHVGTLELVDPSTTRYAINTSNDYVTHTEDGLAQNEWAVRWTPPANDVGVVTIYAAGNAANGDGTRVGDHIYTVNRAVPPQMSTATEDEAVAHSFTLERAYPNPFSTTTTIRYTLREAAVVTLSLYDVLGRRVRLLHQGRQGPGGHQVLIEAGGLPAGLYLYELHTSDAGETRPLLLMR